MCPLSKCPLAWQMFALLRFAVTYVFPPEGKPLRAEKPCFLGNGSVRNRVGCVTGIHDTMKQEMVTLGAPARAWSCGDGPGHLCQHAGPGLPGKDLMSLLSYSQGKPRPFPLCQFLGPNFSTTQPGATETVILSGVQCLQCRDFAFAPQF